MKLTLQQATYLMEKINDSENLQAYFKANGRGGVCLRVEERAVTVLNESGSTNL